MIRLGLREPLKVATPTNDEALSDNWSAQQKIHNEKMIKLNEFILNNSH